MAVIYTSAPTVLSDIGRAMSLAGYEKALPADVPTVLKIALSVAALLSRLFDHTLATGGSAYAPPATGVLVPAQNGTVGGLPHEGEVKNKHKVADRYGLESIHLTDPDATWVRYAPQGRDARADKIFPDGIEARRRS
ncbi:MAG: hypothetical protein U0531_11405 [Dehalococcoidia bacterium]